MYLEKNARAHLLFCKNYHASWNFMGFLSYWKIFFNTNAYNLSRNKFARKLVETFKGVYQFKIYKQKILLSF